MTLLKSIADLTKKVNDVTKEFNITEASLDTQVTSAQTNQAAVEAIETNAQTIQLDANTAASNTATFRTTAESQITYSEITSILESKAITAVDVFVYDTSKDSDGGAWRKRCQHTSWYNETLNTATRGSRREFPAVAVIVAESNKVTIYDGDDSALPMWMVFNENGTTLTTFWYTGRNASSIVIQNGQLAIASNGDTWGALRLADFAGDRLSRRSAVGFYGYTPVSQRNVAQALPFISTDTSAKIVNPTVNDVAMAVLPDAPIDPATGLPVPTIAVATVGGVSVIKDDGTVVTSSRSTSYNGSTTRISFNTDYSLVFQRGGSSGQWFPCLLTSVDDTAAFDITSFPKIAPPVEYFKGAQIIAGDVLAVARGSWYGYHRLMLTKFFDANYQTGMQADIRSDFNTGWMNGDIKGAFLADTNSSSMVGGELITNGNFDENLDGYYTSKDLGFYEDRDVNLSRIENKLRVTSSYSYTFAAQIVPTEVGKTYLLSLNGYAVNGWDVYIGSSINTSNYGSSGTKNALESIIITFTATSTTTYIHFRNRNANELVDQYAEFDNISLKVADSDRSVKNKGLNVSSKIWNPYNYELDFEFDKDSYTVDRSHTNFSSSLLHSRNNNATMTGNYGPELIQNGNFSDNSSWAFSSGNVWTISDGVASCNALSGFSHIQQDLNLVDGKYYEVSADIVVYSGQVTVGLAQSGNGDAESNFSTTVSGKYTRILKHPVSSTYNGILIRAESSGFIGTIDNVSVREIPKIQWTPHNLLPNSENFQNWTKFVLGDVVSTDIEQSPDGNTTADVLTFDDTSGNHIFRKNWSAILGVKYRIGIYLKYNGVQWVLLSDNFTNPGRLWVDLQNGVLGINNATAFDPQIEPLANNWYYVSYTTQEADAVGPQLQIQPTLADNNNGPNYSGNGTTTKLSVWGGHVNRLDLGGMVENPDQPSSLKNYVPTTSSAVYLPRRNHYRFNDRVWVNEGILHESESRTNLLNYSNDFNNSYWTVPRTDITKNSTLSPDGTIAANLFIPTAGTDSDHGVYISQAIPLTQNGIFSVYAKQGPGNYKLSLHPNAGNASAIFNLNTGKIEVNNSGQEANIEYFGNGWYRCSVNVLANTNTYVKIYVADQNNNVSYIPDGTSGIYIWGAQLEEGIFASSYIPTYGPNQNLTTITRSEDMLSIPYSNLPYSTNAITIQIQGKISYDDTNTQLSPIIYRWYKDGNNSLSFRFDTQISGSPRPMWMMETDVQNRYVRNSYGSGGMNVAYNTVGRFSPTVLDGAIDGYELTETNPGISIPNLSTIDLELGQSNYMGTIKRFRMWGNDIKDDGIMVISEPPLQSSLGLQFNSSNYSHNILDWKE